MTGVLKSRGCMKCKARKLKCDQAWPTCTQCKTSRLVCPGPSSLVKFIAHKESGSRVRDPIGERSFSPSPLQVQLREWRPIAPRPKLSSPADQVASRLVGLLEKDPNLAFVFTAGYLQNMPSRLAHSPSLRDCVNLFCNAHADHRQRLRGQSIKTMEEYGKALRTLHNTLQGKQATELETLASIAMLNRAEAVFDPEWRPLRRVHAQGLQSFLMRKGPPEAGDFFHYGVLFESFEDLVSHHYITGEEFFLNQSPWKEAVLEFPFIMISPGLRPYSSKMCSTYLEFTSRAPKLLGKLRKIYQDPHSPDIRRLATKIVAALPVDIERLRNGFDEMVPKALEAGHMEEISDPSSLSGKPYILKASYFGGLVYMTAAFMTAMALIRYNLSVLYELPDIPNLVKEYREACVLLWKFIPFQLEMDKATAPKGLTPLVLTYEAASRSERDYLNKMTLEQDEYRQRLPRDRGKLEAFMIIQAKIMTGRLPMG